MMRLSLTLSMIVHAGLLGWFVGSMGFGSHSVEVRSGESGPPFQVHRGLPLESPRRLEIDEFSGEPGDSSESVELETLPVSDPVVSPAGVVVAEESIVGAKRAAFVGKALSRVWGRIERSREKPVSEIPPESVSIGVERVDPSPLAEINEPPIYPRRAVRRGWEGTVVLRVEVSPDGTVTAVDLSRSSGHRSLDEAAVDAVRSWRFRPARSGDRTVSGWVALPVVFRLEE